MCDVDRGHLERWSSVTVHESSLREDVALVQCHCHVKPWVFFFFLTQRQPQPSQHAAVHISVLFSVDVQIRDERCLSVWPPSCYRHSLLLFIGRLFVCLWWCPCFCSIIQDVFFVSFYRQHASTNATMVFKANCDVHYFHCCLILFGLFSSRIDWQANSPPFFLCCDLCSPSPLFPQSSALREPTVLTIFRRLVDAWLQCCVVLFSLHSYWRKKFEKSHLIFLECLLLSMSVHRLFFFLPF